MSSFESWLLSYLLNSLWQVPLLLVVGWVMARAARTIGDRAEHRVWVSVLVLQSVLPACPALPWEWLRNFFNGSNSAPSTGQVSVYMGAGAGLGDLRIHAGLMAAIACAYTAVTGYFVARFVWRWCKLRAIRREAREIVLPGDDALYWAQCCRRFGIKGVSLAASTRIFSPVTIGLAHKLLLLPRSMASKLPESDLRAVIAHEFAHMSRNDFFKNLVYEILSLPASYHPAVRLTRDRIMESREIVCDRMAAEANGQSQYARSLLRLASLLVAGTPAKTPHTIGIFDANTFERRIMKLTEKHTEVRGLRRVAVLIGCATLGIATCCSALSLHMRVDAAAAMAGASPKAPAYVTVSAGVMQGNRISGPMPKYPPEAKKAGIQGKVALSAIVSKEGNVEMLKVLSGPKELQESARDAVKQWKYKPFLLNGDPVAVKTTVNVIYTLSK